MPVASGPALSSTALPSSSPAASGGPIEPGKTRLVGGVLVRAPARDKDEDSDPDSPLPRTERQAAAACSLLTSRQACEWSSGSAAGDIRVRLSQKHMRVCRFCFAATFGFSEMGSRDGGEETKVPVAAAVRSVPAQEGWLPLQHSQRATRSLPRNSQSSSHGSKFHAQDSVEINCIPSSTSRDCSSATTPSWTLSSLLIPSPRGYFFVLRGQ